MFEQSPENSSRFASGPLRVIAFSAVGLILGFGFCGIDAHLYPHSKFGGGGLALIGTALFAFSALGLVVGIISLVIKLIADAFKR